MEINNTTKVGNLHSEQIKAWLMDYLPDFCIKFGDNLTDQEIEMISTDLSKKLKFDNPNYSISNVKYIFESGFLGKYDNANRLSLRVIFRWFYKGKDDLYQKKNEDKEPEMPMQDKLIALYKMAEEREKETGEKNPFKSCLERLQKKVIK